MSRRRLVLAVAALAASLAVVASAAAHPPTLLDSRHRPIGGEMHRWLHNAKVPLVGGRIVIVRSACPSRPLFSACVHARRPRRIYIRRDVRNVRKVLFHELGHTFDLLVMNNADRRAFKKALGIQRRGWYGGLIPPGEWFADAYALCAVRKKITRRPGITHYGYRPSSKRHVRACRVIKRAAASRGKPPQEPKNPPPVIDSKPPPKPPEKSKPPPPNEPPPCGPLEELLTGCRPAG